MNHASFLGYGAFSTTYILEEKIEDIVVWNLMASGKYSTT
jgi:hypothetical protein